MFAWTLQTYLRLKADGFPCELVGTLPGEGIVLAHRDSLPYNLQPGSKLLIICLKADRELHSYAQLHVVQNLQETFTGSTLFGNRYYIPHWLQPGLISRDPARGDRFENIAYFGLPSNLAPELNEPSWYEQLSELGLRWQVIERDYWHDYSNVDAVLAVRRLSDKGDDRNWKPPSKLLNAWHAGVPAILGCESAFQAERKSELDYLETASLDDIMLALKHLRDDKALRHAMVENGRIRAKETQHAQLSKRWYIFLTEVAIPTYERWCSASTWTQQIFLKRCYVAVKMNSMQRRMQSLVSQVRGT